MDRALWAAGAVAEPAEMGQAGGVRHLVVQQGSGDVGELGALLGVQRGEQRGQHLLPGAQGPGGGAAVPSVAKCRARLRASAPGRRSTQPSSPSRRTRFATPGWVSPSTWPNHSAVTPGWFLRTTSA